MTRQLVNNKLKGMWKEVAMAHFELLSWYLYGVTVENKEVR